MGRGMIDEVAKQAETYFKEGLFCAESVLMAIAEGHGIQSDFIPKIATGFCAGIARTSGICGAVSGGIMAIGMLFGRNAKEQTVDDCYRLIRSFLQAFEARFGSTTCKTLTGCQLDTPEGMRFFLDNGIREKCRGLTKGAAEIAMGIIEEERVKHRPPPSQGKINQNL